MSPHRGPAEITLENCTMLVAVPTKPVRLPHPTHPPPASAGTAWEAPAVLGAIDDQVWEMMEPEDRDALLRRYVRDAGFRKADLKRVVLRLWKIREPRGMLQIVQDPVEVEL